MDAPTPVVFECSGVTVAFGGLTAVDDVAIHVHEREIVGIIGPNGAGKTTLFNAISGFLAVDTGRIALGERDITRLLPYERVRAGLGRTFQQAVLYPNLTVAENLLISAHTHARSGLFSHALRCPRAVHEEKEALDRVSATMDVVDVTDYWKAKAATLSYGTLRMLELACLLVQEPRFLLLDEPAAGIAQRETEALGPLLRRIREGLQTSILLIEHDMPLISSLSDRMYAMNLGRVIAEGTPQEVLSDAGVVASYLGKRGAEKLAAAGKPAGGRTGGRPGGRSGGTPRRTVGRVVDQAEGKRTPREQAGARAPRPKRTKS